MLERPMRQFGAALLVFVPLTALAHPGHDLAGAAAGFAHPFLGLDHLLAMVAVGLWAGRLGGEARWQLPAAFLLAMAAGAGGGLRGLRLPGLETGIAASVVALGLLAAVALRFAAVLRLALVAGFALLHGLAHGAELPAQAGALTYVLAFLAATALLHALGLVLAVRLDARWQPWLGAAVAAAGTGLLLG